MTSSTINLSGFVSSGLEMVGHAPSATCVDHHGENVTWRPNDPAPDLAALHCNVSAPTLIRADAGEYPLFRAHVGAARANYTASLTFKDITLRGGSAQPSTCILLSGNHIDFNLKDVVFQDCSAQGTLVVLVSCHSLVFKPCVCCVCVV